MSSINAIGLEGLSDTVFLKDFTRDNEKLRNLEDLLEKTKDTDLAQANKLRKDIYLKKQGLYGENSVYFELKNSLLPMICFHDINIKVNQNSAQIDFLVVTNKFICIMETKNLVGDITITEDGDFIREIKYKDGITREGMYNPITQGSRHARILKKALINAGVVEADKFPIKSIAVMANHKNIIDKKDAPIDISKNIYRCDQIVNFLEREMSSSEYTMILPDSKIRNISNLILRIANNESLQEEKYNAIDNNSTVEGFKNNERSVVIPFTTPSSQEYSKSSFISPNVESSSNTEKVNNTKKVSNINISVPLDISYYQDDKLVRTLKKFRYESAQAHNRKPYEVFTNKEMDLLVSNKPKTINDLKKFNLRSWVINELGVELLQVINPEISYPKTTVNMVALAKAAESRLKKYRDDIAISSNLKPYEIFTNAEITRLIEANPSTLDELFEIKGFNRKDKLIRYGNDILNILNS